MPSRERKRRKIQQASSEAPVTPTIVIQPKAPQKPASESIERFQPQLGIQPELGTSGTALQVVAFLAAFAVILLRRPDAVMNAQFWAEDGMVWYPDAYRFGLHAFLMPVAGYVHLYIRSIAQIAVWSPFSVAPLVMNLSAILVQILPINLFLSSRFSQIPLKTRFLGALLYLILPNSWEIHANLTNVQWHLVLLACLILLAELREGIGWRAFDVVVVAVTSFSSPIAVLLVPVAAALWWTRRQQWRAISLALLVPGAVVEILFGLLSHTRQAAPNGPTLERLSLILGGQVFFAGLFGMQTLNWFAPKIVLFITIAAAAGGLTLVTYALWHGPIELKSFILFCFGVLVMALVRPLAGPPDHPQWWYLCIPGRGNRYYFLPMLAFFASLLWVIGRAASPRPIRYLAVSMLFALPIGVWQDWSYPRFVDYHFQQYAKQFEYAPSGTKVAIPINPGMTMEITKR